MTVSVVAVQFVHVSILTKWPFPLSQYNPYVSPQKFKTPATFRLAFFGISPKTHRNDDGSKHRSFPRKKSSALTDTARQWTRWENRSDRCHCCCRSITLAPVTSSNGCFAPVHQELPTAPHHQITTPRSHLSIFLLFMTQVLPLDIAMVELLPCLQFFCQLEGHFVSWAYDFERCGRGGGRFGWRRLTCIAFGGGIGCRSLSILHRFRDVGSLFSCGWTLYPFPWIFFDWIPTELCLFLDSVVSVFFLGLQIDCFAFAFKPALLFENPRILVFDLLHTILFLYCIYVITFPFINI